MISLFPGILKPAYLPTCLPACSYSAATWAESVGGVAALIKSIAPWGLQTCHTGLSQTAGIAAGAISHEDSAQLRRMQERGTTPVVTMVINYYAAS